MEQGCRSPGLRTPGPVLIWRSLSAAAGAPEDAAGEKQCAGWLRLGGAWGCPGQLCQSLGDGENKPESPPAFWEKDAEGGSGYLCPEGGSVVEQKLPAQRASLSGTGSPGSCPPSARPGQSMETPKKGRGPRGAEPSSGPLRKAEPTPAPGGGLRAAPRLRPCQLLVKRAGAFHKGPSCCPSRGFYGLGLNRERPFFQKGRAQEGSREKEDVGRGE